MFARDAICEQVQCVQCVRVGKKFVLSGRIKYLQYVRAGTMFAVCEWVQCLQCFRDSTDTMFSMRACTYNVSSVCEQVFFRVRKQLPCFQNEGEVACFQSERAIPFSE